MARLLSLDIYVLAGVVLVAGIGLALAVLWLSLKLLRIFHFNDHEYFGWIFSDCAGGIFMIFFAMVILAVWQNHDRLAGSATQEAHILHGIYRNLATYPQPVRDPIRTEMKAYAQGVIQREWAAMQRDERDGETQRRYQHFSHLLAAYRPSHFSEVPLHGETLRALTELRSVRLDRLRGSGSYLDAGMWITLLVSSLGFLVYSCLYRMPSLRLNVVMVAFLGGAFAMMFFILFLYNNPYLGPAAVQPDEMRFLLQDYWKLDEDGLPAPAQPAPARSRS